MIILGSGFSACLTAIMIPNCKMLETTDKTPIHNAILRFRTDRISKITGIPFKKVKVYKGIWYNDKEVKLSPRYIAQYARKVSNTITARSIVNQETVDRYIAPSDLYAQMLKLAGEPLYDRKLVLNKDQEPVISTIPLNVTCFDLGISIKLNTIMSNLIYISKYEISNCDIYMTNYYPESDTGVYRASLSGNELIIESINKILTYSDMSMVKKSFGIDTIKPKLIIASFEQHDGKLVPFDDKERKALIYKLTKEYNIYSIGRYAIWKNILLDDVVQDIEVVKRMIYKSEYDRSIGK